MTDVMMSFLIQSLKRAIVSRILLLMLAIIAIVYRNYEVLNDFITSLSLQSSRAYTLYLVDATDENERQVIPWIRKIEDKVVYLPTENKGYAHGVNVGIREAIKAGVTHYAIVNPDIVFDTEFVWEATHAIARNPRSVLGGKIYYAPGYEYHEKKEPLTQVPYPNTPKTYFVWYAGATANWAHATITHTGVDELDSAKYNTPMPTDMVSGCLMLYDKTVHDIVGAWDTGYFMYYEDADFCVRAHKKNIKVLFEPRVVVWHKNAQSTGGSGSAFHSKHMRQAQLRFGLKYAPLRTKVHLVKNYVLRKQ